MPIFEALRAQGNLPCTYPLHVTSSHGTAFIRGGSHSTPLSPHAPHCHPQMHWVSYFISTIIAAGRVYLAMEKNYLNTSTEITSLINFSRDTINHGHQKNHFSNFLAFIFEILFCAKMF